MKRLLDCSVPWDAVFLRLLMDDGRSGCVSEGKKRKRGIEKFIYLSRKGSWVHCVRDRRVVWK